jgi:hypothetical protein
LADGTEPTERKTRPAGAATFVIVVVVVLAVRPIGRLTVPVQRRLLLVGRARRLLFLASAWTNEREYCPIPPQSFASCIGGPAICSLYFVVARLTPNTCAVAENYEATAAAPAGAHSCATTANMLHAIPLKRTPCSLAEVLQPCTVSIIFPLGAVIYEAIFFAAADLQGDRRTSGLRFEFSAAIAQTS